MKRILVTGATSFLGSHIVKYCVQSGYAVKGAVRSGKELGKTQFFEGLKNEGGKVELVETNISDPAAMTQAAEGCDAVIHAATPMLNINTLTQKTEQEVIAETQAIHDCALKHNIKSIVATGNLMSVLRYNRNDSSLKNKAVLDKLYVEAGFMKGKMLAEKLAWNHYESLPQDRRYQLTYIYPGMLLGPMLMRHMSGSVNAIKHILAHRNVYHHTSFPIVDVRDAALAHVKAVLNPIADGKRYICASGSVWHDEIPQLLNKEIADEGYSCKKLPGGQYLLRLYALFSQRIKVLQANIGREFEFSNEEIIKDLGITFRSPQEAIVESARSLFAFGILRSKSSKTSSSSSPK